MIIVPVIAGLALMTLQSSFVEWAFHRYWLHRPWLPKNCFTTHTLIHHQLCKFDDTFHVVEEEQHEALTFAWWGGPVLIAISVAPWALLSWGLAAAHVALPYLPFLIGMAVAVTLYYIGYEGFHFLMHKPGVAWIERSRYFRFLERHHRIHHVQMDKNLNVLFPLADFLLGSLVTESAAPVATPAAARKLARRHSRFGRKVRDEVRARDEQPTA